MLKYRACQERHIKVQLGCVGTEMHLKIWPRNVSWRYEWAKFVLVYKTGLYYKPYVLIKTPE